MLYKFLKLLVFISLWGMNKASKSETFEITTEFIEFFKLYKLTILVCAEKEHNTEKSPSTKSIILQ